MDALTFTFMDSTHEITREEIAAVGCTGRSDWHDYARKPEDPVARLLDTCVIMHKRQGTTEHGARPVEPKPVDRAKVMHQELIHLEGYSCPGKVKKFKSKDDDFLSVLRINPRAVCKLCARKFRELNMDLS